MARARVLVADDNEAIRDVLVSLLEDHFDVILAVSGGGAALAAATKFLPDVVILDISNASFEWNRGGSPIKRSRQRGHCNCFNLLDGYRHR